MHSLKKNWWKISVFICYVTFLGIAIGSHEPWFDEAQAWLLARDSSVFDLIAKYMRYEGSPGLWHLVLTLPAKLGLPYSTLNIVSGVIAATSICLFLRYSPFPAFIKVLYPFSFFAFYQYAVVARSYVLLPLILFLIAIIYKTRTERTYTYTLLLCLLANVCTHGLVIAGSLAFINSIQNAVTWGNLQSSIRRKQLVSLSLFCSVLILEFFQLKPVPDLISLAAFKLDMSAFYPRGITMLSDALTTNSAATANVSKVFLTLAQCIAQFSIFVSLLWFGIRRRLILFVVPASGLFFLFAVVYANVWHQGTLFLLWIFVLWISFESREHNGFLFTKVAKNIVIVSLLLVLSVQICWSYNSFMYDFKNNYSASKELANYIKTNNLDKKRIYINNFYPVSILPYFKSNLFCNYNNGQKPCFWYWSTKNSMYTEPFNLYKRYDPDYIIYSIKSFTNLNMKQYEEMLPKIPDYSIKKVFVGGLYWKDRVYETDSYALYEKNSF